MNYYRIMTLASLIVIIGCGELDTRRAAPEVEPSITSDAGPLGDGEVALEVESQGSELSGNIRYSGSGSPFMIAQWERAAKHDRIIARAPAFEQCVRNTMGAPRPGDGSAGRPGAPRYMACGASEPNSGETISVQTDRLLSILRNVNNDLLTQLNPLGSTEAAYQGYGTHGVHGVQAGRGFHESHPDWRGYSGIEPWNFHAGTVMHEFLHTHDYGHFSSTCDATTCTSTECRWTSVCGGSGTPPSGMGWGNVGIAERNYCAWLRVGDDTAYMAAGEPSAPYIVSECAGSIFDQSEAQCAGGIFDNAACAPGQLRLLTSWTGTEADAQSSTSCACYADPRHVVAFQTPTGQYLTAWEGGGRNIRTRVSNRLGPWQTFFAMEQSASPWRAHDSVQLKAFNGDWVDGMDFRADRSTPFNLTIGHPTQSTSTILGNGSRIAIRSGTRHALDNGSELVASTAPVGTSGAFTMVELDRSTIVYLRGDHGLFVNVDANGNLWNQGSDANLRNLSPTFDRFRMAAGFRLIDWNGGSLRSGDTVSLEALVGDTWHFVSAPTASGQMRLNHSVATTERFVIRKVSGSSGSNIGHDDQVSFRSHNGHFISAMPSADSRQLTNAGTWEGPWQRFTLRLVQHHDTSRPTW